MPVITKEPTLADLHQAILDYRHASHRAAAATRCRHCGIADTARTEAAKYALLRIALGLPVDDVDVLLADLSADDDDA